VSQNQRTNMPTSSTSASDVEVGNKVEKASTDTKSLCTPLRIFLVIFGLLAIAGLVVGLVVGLGRGFDPRIQGQWVTNYGTSITMTPTHMYSVSSYGTSVSTINRMVYGTDASAIIMQNPADATFNPSLWTKLEYHMLNPGWGYCSSVYDGASAQATLDTDTTSVYDHTNANTGCNGFPHTTVTALAMPVAGSWSDNFGATLTINENTWTSESSYGTSVHRIHTWGTNYVLMQNPSDDQFNPDLWTKVDFVMSGTSFGFCMSVYNGADAIAALNTDVSATWLSGNTTHGCNGFPHSIASPA